MNILKWIIKFIRTSIVIILLFILLFINIKICCRPDYVKNSNGIFNLEVYHQLKYLKASIENGSDVNMQKIYPEGYVFMNVLYGLSWMELIENLKSSSDIHNEAIEEVEKTIIKLREDRAKEVFTKDLPLEYGAFYRGWTNYLIGKYLQKKNTGYDRSIENLFMENCEDISKIFEGNSYPFIETYNNITWPADNSVCMASLSIYDQIYGDKYSDLRKKWIISMNEYLDEETGLVPHEIYFGEDTTQSISRGSSQILNLLFLKEIDSDFAEKQFELFESHFVNNVFGLSLVNEYAKGLEMDDKGDIDSGPVFFGIGASATLVGQKTLAVFGKWDNYYKTKSIFEIFGLSYTYNSKRRFLFGNMPIVDAFLTWSYSSDNNQKSVNILGWRSLIHFISILIFILFFNRKYVIK